MNPDEKNEDTGIVKEIIGDCAVVELLVNSSCESCAMHGLCGGAKKVPIHKIKNDFNLKPGDKVELEISAGTKVFSSVILFLLPIVSMLLFYAIAKAVGFSEDVSIIVSFAGLLASGIAIRYIDKAYQNKLNINIVRKISE
ncbi:MAG: SoxR reducing system RseC family protein [Candidatus Cloacimonetes bacterium]|nr:SoxR reducing system RseC family protein [Candidatus Cloacimonadota bacterium]